MYTEANPILYQNILPLVYLNTYFISSLVYIIQIIHIHIMCHYRDQTWFFMH